MRSFLNLLLHLAIICNLLLVKVDGAKAEYPYNKFVAVQTCTIPSGTEYLEILANG
jgi:hypothetical protein